ncbi:MAG: integrase arm-type DNA-binding domain-containing protein [Marinosulfonomonas sp.]
MPNLPLTKRPNVAKIKHPDSGTVFYSDPTLKTDPDAKGIRLAVGARQKVWWVARRIDGKVKQIRLGEWPTLPDVYAARDIAKEKMAAVATHTDVASTGLFGHLLRRSCVQTANQVFGNHGLPPRH